MNIGRADELEERAITVVSLIALFALGALSAGLALFGQGTSSRFLLALYPLLVVLAGVAFLRQSGLIMAFAGLALAIVLAVFAFKTPFEVALGASAVGFIKSFGISISVSATMLMIYLMKEAGALETVSKVIKHQVVGNEVQALYIGIGFGSFLSALGVVTPALFPPLLVTMGFSPVAAVAIAVLGYDPTTSFSLLSIPITLPAEQSMNIIGTQISATVFAFKIALFLPLISTAFAFGILWLLGGKQSMRRGAVPALVSGLALGLACLGEVGLDNYVGAEVIPLRIVGVVAGLCAMVSLYGFQKLRRVQKLEKPTDYPSRGQIMRAFSPWIMLSVLALIVGVPQIGKWLSDFPGNIEKIVIFSNKPVDLDILFQIYTWIFVAIALSIATLRLSRKQVFSATKTWSKRVLGPFFAYSLYFCIAYVMAWSAMSLSNGALVSDPNVFNQYNMNMILGLTLASIFGAGYIFVAASLGLFGAVVGGSETSSNVLFMSVQKTAATGIGLNDAGFMTIYGSHAVAGGIASAITPAKINNAVVTIDAGHKTESAIMRNHLIIALLLTIATGILTGVLVNLGI